MKRILFIAASTFLMITAYSQNLNVPAPVLNNFNSQFQNAQNVNWSTYHNDHIATFTSGGVNQVAAFDANGTWLRTETQVDQSNLSSPVSTEINNRFLGQNSTYSFVAAYTVTTGDGNEEAVLMNTGNSQIKIYFNPSSGQMLRRMPL